MKPNNVLLLPVCYLHTCYMIGVDDSIPRCTHTVRQYTITDTDAIPFYYDLIEIQAF